MPAQALCYKKASNDCWKNAKHNRFPRQFESARGYFWPAMLWRHAIVSHISKSGKALDDLGKPKGKASVSIIMNTE